MDISTLTLIDVFPDSFTLITKATLDSGFTMASDPLTCSLLRTLAASKPSGNFLELGTGTGLSTAWILDGMDPISVLTTVDNDPDFLSIARDHLGSDSRLTLILQDCGEWLTKNSTKKFDYIFADTWHGKYLMLDVALSMLNPGGLYIIDDMLPQDNWPSGHSEKADSLISYLSDRDDLYITKQIWASGIIIGVKIAPEIIDSGNV